MDIRGSGPRIPGDNHWQSHEDLRSYGGRRVKLLTLGEEPSYSSYDSTPSYLSFSFNYVRNQGAAWGAFSDLKDSIRIPFFYVVTLLATILVFFYLKTKNI